MLRPLLQKQNIKTGAKEANLTAVTRDWAKAGDWCQSDHCRKRCMDLVSLETEAEAEWDQVRAEGRWRSSRPYL